MATVIYNGKEYTAEEFGDALLKEKEGLLILREEAAEWIDGLFNNGTAEYCMDEDTVRNNWLTKKENSIRTQVKAAADADLKKLYPGKSNKQQREQEKKKISYMFAIETETTSLMAEYKQESFWEANYADILAKARKNPTRKLRNAIIEKISARNNRILDAYCDSHHVDQLIQDAEEEAERRYQEIFDTWLRSEKAGYYEEVYRERYWDDDDYYDDDYDEFDDLYDDYDDPYMDECDYKFVKLSADNVKTFLSEIQGIEKDDTVLLPDILGKEYSFIDDIVTDIVTEKLPDMAKVKEIAQPFIGRKFGSLIDSITTKMVEALDDSKNHILKCLSENPTYQKSVKAYEEKKRKEEEAKRRKAEEKRQKEERLARIKEGILTAIPDKYPDLYPLARKIYRHFILHIGPTNSGKTYAAMQRVREAGAGIYLAPLRLLAFEQYEQLNADGFPCSLVTGEERELIKEAKIQASTVEMMDPVTSYPVAVIDEAQMVADKSRGWAWTAAILGVCSPEVHVCASPDAENILKALVDECGDSYEIVRHERQTELKADTENFSFPKKVRKGDALIVFSRRNVHAVAYELRKRGVSCSIIYGNLPYDVRQAEAKKFASGETDVLVATDAIGMGLNLPIQRVVFLELSKYDGETRRLLKPAEAQQIAGRAGRRGMFDEGLYNSDTDFRQLKALMAKEVPPVSLAVIGFPESLVGVEGKLSEILAQWEKTLEHRGYKRMDLTTIKRLTQEIEPLTDDKRLTYNFATIPFDPDSDAFAVWQAMVRKEIKGERLTLEEAERIHPLRVDGMNLESMEHAYKVCDLLYSYNERFEHQEDIPEILQTKKDLSRRILRELSTKGLQPRRCKYCGKQLPWNHPYGMCEECHDRMYPPRYANDYWY